MGADRFSTSARLKAFGQEAQARVYRAAGLPRQGATGPVRRNKLTGRAALLGLVVCALVVALAYPMRSYVAQRSDIADQRRAAQQAKQKVEQLRREKARWQDPDYVRTQARLQLHYVMPGETGYSVAAGPSPTPDPAADHGKGNQAAAVRPWYDNLWDSVDHADAAGAPPAAAR
ncbi:FtsB family cell division protein [Actinacidiphila acididurans]|uniref:Septum formation initiator family protein n=1 Tax=Actinacidiphila acididurans TaxID=2784346 RepID=A0ABS2TQ73_9ACTN|nr:septum formation initiator family protein [Actinacidiphila acididurans]MBM9504982.1 septum formation initiator family protein [Actinacidiphila acididurans]